MFKKISKWSIISLVLSLLLTVGVLTVFHACEMKDDGTWMHCHVAQTYVAICGGLLCLLFLISSFVNNNILRMLIDVVGIVLSILIMFLPGGFVSMCMMKTMRCYIIMQPFVRIMAVLICICCVLGGIQSWKAVKRT